MKLWKKIKQKLYGGKEYLPYPVRFCDLLISEKYNEIIFVPYGKMRIGAHTEIDKIIIDKWPCKFDDLQKNIEKTLNEFLGSTNLEAGKWLSYEISKAKTQNSFETDYVRIRLETDLTKGYGNWEVERIKVSAIPTKLDTTFSLVGVGHLLETTVAQIVIDIFEACSKIRN